MEHTIKCFSGLAQDRPACLSSSRTLPLAFLTGGLREQTGAFHRTLAHRRMSFAAICTIRRCFMVFKRLSQNTEIHFPLEMIFSNSAITNDFWTAQEGDFIYLHIIKYIMATTDKTDSSISHCQPLYLFVKKPSLYKNQ